MADEKPNGKHAILENLKRGEVEVLRRLEVTIRQARDDAHQAMFFLGLLYRTGKRSTTDAVRSYAAFAFSQLRRLVAPVRYDERLEEVIHVLREGLANGITKSRGSEQIRVYRAALERWNRAAETLRLATNLPDGLDDGDTLADEPPDLLAAASDVRSDLKTFLADAKQLDFGRRLVTHLLPDLLRFLHKNLALLVTSAVAAFVLFKVEIVNSLLRNQPWFTALVIAVLLFPAMVIVVLQLRSRWTRDGEGLRIPFWDVGGRAFRSYRAMAVEPARQIRRWQQPEPPDLPPSAREAADPTMVLKHLLRGQFAPEDGGINRALLAGRGLIVGVYAVWWLTWLAIIWTLFPRTTPTTPHLTIYLLLSLLGALVGFARLVDFWEFFDHRPIRLLILLAGGALFAFLLLDAVRWLFVPLGLAAVAFGWYYFQDRSKKLRPILAGLFATLAVLNWMGRDTELAADWVESPPSATAGERTRLERLGAGDWPRPNGGGPVVVMAASGGGSRSAVYTALTLQRLHEDHPEVARSLQAIGSVSGGSLANAAYLARRLDASTRGEPADWGALVSSLRADFLRPMLKSIFVPGLNRGDAIEKEWQGFVPRSLKERFIKDDYVCGQPTADRDTEGVGLRNYCLSDLVRRWRADANGVPFPLPLFHATSLDGHAVVISPLDKKLYTRPELPTQWATATIEIPTWVFDRDGIYALEDFLGDYDPPLSSAVRASANFPFGFPLVRIKTRRPLHFSPFDRDRHENGDERQVFLTDGGALSNSGMWSLFNLLTHERLVPELRQRGVLVVIVEASKMPIFPRTGRLVNLWGAIADQGPIGQSLHRRMLDALEATYGDRLAVLQIDLVPDEKRNVLTTWALAEQSFEELERSFKERWDEKAVHLCHKWRLLSDVSPTAHCREILKNARDEKLGGLVDRARPPLD